MLIDESSFFERGLYSFENFLKPPDGCARYLAYFCLLWLVVFGISLRTANQFVESRAFLIWANSTLVVIFGGLQTYYWMESR